MKKSVIKYYEYFFQEISGNRGFTFNIKDSQKSLIDNFVKMIPETAGEDWLFDFFLYQFSRYYDKKTRFGTGIVMLNWVIGKKALQEYKNRTEQQLHFVNEFRVRYELKPFKEVESKEIIQSLKKDRIGGLRKCKNIVACSMSIFELTEIFNSILCMGCESFNYCKSIKNEM